MVFLLLSEAYFTKQHFAYLVLVYIPRSKEKCISLKILLNSDTNDNLPPELSRL